ncbi:hypothetical protein [Streptomyces sp. NPDC060184]|uniref:hypothetical protein n=1 Tax=Streptomyces sp. NPDC060184 TaxID=3347064 RepID=UPI0036554825
MAPSLERVTAFRSAFARRQAAETFGLPGAFAVRDPGFPLSEEHNRLIVDTPDADPVLLYGAAARVLGPREQYRMTVLDEALGEDVTPALTAAGCSRRGHGDTLLASGLARAAAAGIPHLFLLADASDWQRDWYTRRGFTEIGRSHSFLGG